MSESDDRLAFRCVGCGGVNRVAPDRLKDGPTCGRCKAKLDLAAHPQDVDDDALDRLVASAPVPVLVDFWAPWCGPCRMVAPVVAQVAKDHAGKLVAVKVNTDQHKRAFARTGAQGIPHFVLYAKGAEVASTSGAMSRPALEAFVARAS